MEERRQVMEGLVERVAMVEADIKEIKAQVASISEIRDILAEGRAAFKFAGRVAHFVTWTVRATALVLLPGMVLAAGLYALTHGGSPPPWLEQWVNMARGK